MNTDNKSNKIIRNYYREDDASQNYPLPPAPKPKENKDKAEGKNSDKNKNR